MSDTAAVEGRAKKRGLFARLASIDDGTIIRIAFYAMLLGTAGVLYIDFSEQGAVELPFSSPRTPILPPIDPATSDGGPVPEVTTDWQQLDAPMALDLVAGGTLALTGTIDIGAYDRFRAEVEARGEYIRVVSLDSPGGSVIDAVAIGELIRARGFSTSVDAGSLCASSCPLILAGGVERLAGEGAAIGVHQIYASAATSDAAAVLADAGTAMSEAQRTTALISRYLGEMGIDPAFWLHALETPPQSLYYFSTEEMTELKLITDVVMTAAPLT